MLMRNHYSTLAFAIALAVGGGVSYAAPQRIIIDDEKPLEIYALGASSKVGVYKLNPTDLSNPTILARGTWVQYTGSGVGGGGTFLDAETVVGVKYNYSPYPFEATAAGTEDGPWAHSYFAASYYIPGNVYDMAYDETSGDIYCWYDVNSFNKCLGKYDRASHTITRVGSAPSTAVYAIAIDADGQLWGVGTYGMLSKIDKITGVVEDVTGGAGSRAQFQTNMPMSAAIDPASGIMYIVGRAGSYDTYASMMKVNLSDYSVENLGALDGYFNCLYIAGSSIADGAPAPAENLAAAFNGTKTVVTFTAPSQTHSGGKLSGELDYTITVDGEEVATGNVNAGEEASKELDLADGTHEITVVLSNAAGAGKSAKTSVFSGFDVPGNISGLTATAEGSKVSLAWTAPEGVNGGILDMSKLRYTVTRGSDEVASALEATSADDEVSGNVKQYTYTVTVVYDGAAGQSQSVTVMAGAPYDIPYALDLNGIESFGEAGVTVLDPNTGNSAASPTWSLTKVGEENCAVSFSSLYYNRSEYLFLPPASYKASAIYTLTFKVAASGTNAYNLKTAKLRVLMAAEPTSDEEALTDLYTNPLDDTKNYIEVAAKANEYDWADCSVEFTVAEDGVYSVGIEDFANFYENDATVAVKDLAISVRYPTPANVSDFTATPQAGNNRNIDLSFKLPANDADGFLLSTLSKVDIYRGSELIATLTEDLTPGTTKTYTDEMAPRGYRSYHVVAFNGNAASGAEYATVMSGYLNNLMITSVSLSESVIPVDGVGELKVTVKNDGFEQVLYGSYDVVLLCDGEGADYQTGSAVKSDQETDFVFDIWWTPESPAKATYKAVIVFDGDENSADDSSEEVEVEFEPAPTGVTDIAAAGVTVKAAAGVITVAGAQGMNVNVYATDGTLVETTASASASYTTRELPAGVYIVVAGTQTFKVAI